MTEASHPPEAEALPARPLLALLVDDSPTARGQLAEALVPLGFEVLAAAEAGEALRLLDGRPLDVVLLDVVMPGMDGLALCRVIRSLPAYAAVPVILLSGRGALLDQARGLLAGADVCLAKPIDPSVLARTVRGQLLKRHAPAVLRARGLRDDGKA